MKSIMEEASSIAKAIEKGWIRAGKPQEFTVKVFEEPQKNFIGLTTKAAKIGLFFEEIAPKRDIRPQRQQQPRSFKEEISLEFQKQPQKQDRLTQNKRPGPQEKPQQFSKQPEKAGLFDKQDRLADKSKQHKNELPVKSREAQFTSPWSAELTESAQEWIKNSLTVLGMNNLGFNSEVDRYALRVTFLQPITQNNEKEKMLYRSWAYLIMQALRQKFKRPLKGLKIILMSNA